MKMVTRSVNVTRCVAFDPVNPNAETFDVELSGKWGAPRLASYVRKKYGQTYAIRDVEVSTVTYGMPFDAFIDYAEVITG